MRVAADQLVGRALERLGECGATTLGELLHAEDREEREISQLLGDGVRSPDAIASPLLDGLLVR
jgi:hypothetical protein